MIYIYTVEHDENVNPVMDWLRKSKVEHERINGNNFYHLFNNKQNHYLKDDVHWFYKWQYPKTLDKSGLTGRNKSTFYNAINTENDTLFKLYFDNYVYKAINHPSDVDIDKYSQLKIAKQNELQIPESIITSNKDTLKEFKSQYSRIITKNLQASFSLYFENEVYQSFTSEVFDSDIQSLPIFFYPSFFQELIEKDFELRIIYIDSHIYTCAILPNENNLDIRESVNTSQAVMLPYQLPVDIEMKICNFMKSINLQIGSLDMIYSKKGEYIFLEVNPSGQFLGYSNSCNYNIEKHIAYYLIERSHEG